MQASLRLMRVSFSYREPVLAGASALFNPGWTGVVGPNGAGKTTLLRLLAGELHPDQGHVALDPPGAPVHLCPQRVEAIDVAILDFAASWTPLACRWRGRLDLDPEALARWDTLSPGERKRWQVGAALAREPAVLLLDEPTNHLDVLARDRLSQALRAYKGVGVVVSHDRALLDALTRATVKVEGASLTAFPGCYSAARDAWRAEAESLAQAWDQARAEERRQERRLHEARAARAAADAQRSTRARVKGPRDHDGRSMGAKFRVQTAEAGLGRQVAAVHARLERASEARVAIHLQRELGAALFVDEAPAPKARLLQLQAAEVRAGDAVILRDVDLTVERHSRVHLRGPNGAGKTTLLRALLAEARLPAERVLVLPQELSAAEGRALLAEVLAMPSDEQGRLLQIVAALGVDPARLRASVDPSPGEARKLAVALGLARRVWLLVLDEPTNHLDLPSIERIEAALQGYQGALLVVTHDPDFAAALTTERWDVGEGRVMVGRREGAD